MKGSSVLMLYLLVGALYLLAGVQKTAALTVINNTSLGTEEFTTDAIENRSPSSRVARADSGLSSVASRCLKGFEPSNDGTCVDINECRGFKDTSAVLEEDRRDICGNYVHSHRPGYRCVNTPGSYRCERIVDCGFGYKLNETLGVCVDIDECAVLGYEAACGMKLPIKVCVNLEGSFRCDYRSCPPGKHLDRTTGQCNPCRRGFEKNDQNVCVDINECDTSRQRNSSGQVNSCPPHMRCVNYVGGYECRHKIFCPMGRRANYNGTMCIDINECAEHPRICGVGRNCINLDGSYRCESKQCGKLQELNSQTGDCVCTEGFRMNATSRLCEDINECTEGLHNCDVNDVCRNTRGHFDCLSRDKVCEPGFGLSFDHSSCVDIDECRLGHHKCGRNEVCNNTHGSYVCLCAAGFGRVDFRRECIDIDECSINGTQLCSEPLVCRNIPGSYSCSCPDGYRRRELAASNTTASPCADIDECFERPNICGSVGTCHNRPAGAYTCTCPPGYMATEIFGGTCADIDECKLNACPAGAACRNTPGGYDCQCRSGFVFNRRTNLCEDIDECQQMDKECSAAGSSCFNYRGHYACYRSSCPTGFNQTATITQSNTLTFGCMLIGSTCRTLPSFISDVESPVCVERHRIVHKAMELSSSSVGSSVIVQSDWRFGQRQCQFRATLYRANGIHTIATSNSVLTDSPDAAVKFKQRQVDRYTTCSTELRNDGGNATDTVTSALIEVAIISNGKADILNNTVHMVYVN